MKLFTKLSLALTLLLALGFVVTVQAQDSGKTVRLKIDAKVDGERTKIDTVINNFDSFDLDAYLAEQGLGEDMEGLKSIDVRIMEDDMSKLDMEWLENLEENAFFNEMRVKVESIEMPDIPQLPSTANMMFLNGNRAFLGVVTKNTSDKKGVEIKEVVENSAAAAAGLEQGDILISVNDMTVESTNNLIEILSDYQPGESVSVTYLRNGKRNTTTAELKENENYFESEEWEVYGSKWEEWGESFGAQMEEWGAQMENHFNKEMIIEEKAFLGVFLDADDDGVLITGISENSAAEAAGLKKGDVITSIDGTKMSSHKQVADYIQSKQSGDVVTIGILRDEKPMNIDATLKSHQTEMIYWKDEEGNIPNHFQFFGPKSDCNSYTYEFKDGGQKEIIMEIEVIEEEALRETPEGEAFKASDVEFFPNPSSGTFSLRFNADEPEDVLINIRDINGALVYDEELKGFSGVYDKSINLGDEAKGNYFINIVKGDYIVTKQIVIQ